MNGFFFQGIPIQTKGPSVLNQEGHIPHPRMEQRDALNYRPYTDCSFFMQSNHCRKGRSVSVIVAWGGQWLGEVSGLGRSVAWGGQWLGEVSGLGRSVAWGGQWLGERSDLWRTVRESEGKVESLL